jgi:hypothetical protein
MNGHGPFVSLDPSADRVSDLPVLHRRKICRALSSESVQNGTLSNSKKANRKGKFRRAITSAVMRFLRSGLFDPANVRSYPTFPPSIQSELFYRSKEGGL